MSILLLLFSALFPIIAALGLGLAVGKYTAIHRFAYLGRSISWLAWGLLIAIGCSFGKVLSDPHISLKIIQQALIFTSVIVVVTFLLLSPLQEKNHRRQRQIKDIIQPIKSCCYAIMMVIIGVFIYNLFKITFNVQYIVNTLLYILIFFVGIDLSLVKLAKPNKFYFIVPFTTILGMIIAAYITAIISAQPFHYFLIAGSGLGWFSLSGPLVSQFLGQEWGALALLTDLFREFYSILLLFLLGGRYALGVTAVCAATAMDSTLPFVKKNCSAQHVQIAIFSGLVLTLLAPFSVLLLISVFA